MLKVSAVMLRSLHSMLQTMEMLPVRVVLGALPPNTLEETPLPRLSDLWQDQYFLSMKLTYREGTPSDYEPVGFVKSAGGLRFATRPIRMGVGPTIRTKHNSMGLDLLAEDAEGFETCEKIGQQVPSGGWAMEIGRLGPRVCQSDETKKVSVEDDRVVATAKCVRSHHRQTNGVACLASRGLMTDHPGVCRQGALRGRLGLCPQPEPGRAHLDATARQEMLHRHRHSRAAAPDAGEGLAGLHVQA